jgi:hypothetical protein
MGNKIFWLGILVIGMAVVGCDNGSTGKREKTPEEMTEAKRWDNSWVDPTTSVTVTHSVAKDGVCTITVGGTPAKGRWQGNVGYLYTVKKDAHYTYKIEAWTQSGDRALGVQYFGGGDTNTIGGPPYLGQSLNISTTRKTYTFVGENVPREGVLPLEIQCADQIGTFYVKVISITEGGVFTDNTNISGIKMRSVSPTTGLKSDEVTTFTIIVDYLFYGFKQGEFSIQFGHVDGDSWTKSNETSISKEGSGTLTFTVELTVGTDIDWFEPEKEFYVRCELNCWNDNVYHTGFWTTPIKLSFE